MEVHAEKEEEKLKDILEEMLKDRSSAYKQEVIRRINLLNHYARKAEGHVYSRQIIGLIMMQIDDLHID